MLCKRTRNKARRHINLQNKTNTTTKENKNTSPNHKKHHNNNKTERTAMASASSTIVLALILSIFSVIHFRRMGNTLLELIPNYTHYVLLARVFIDTTFTSLWYIANGN